MRGRAAEPLVHRHGGPLRAPRQAEQDLCDPGRVRHQGRGAGAPRVRDLQSGEHHHTSRFQVTDHGVMGYNANKRESVTPSFVVTSV